MLMVFQNTARRSNAALEAISSTPQSHLLNEEKMTHCIYEKFIDLVE